MTDATGLTGTYDFDVWWTVDDLEPDGPASTGAPTLRSAIQSLGLKLEAHKGPLEVIVIDRVARLPEEN